MPGVIPRGKVDWDGQHCRFCRFLILLRVSSSLNPDFKGSSGPDACARAAKAARNGKDVATDGKVGGKNGKGGKPKPNPIPSSLAGMGQPGKRCGQWARAAG